MKSDAEPKVVVSWRMTDGKLSSAWLRLVRKLCASRKEKPVDVPQDAGNGKCEDGEKRHDRPQKDVCD